MAEMSPDVKKALDEQKKNCPFCKMIQGEIPVKETYKDSKVYAILDINPLYTGHTLLMPIEHFPILPYMGKDLFSHAFKIVQEMCFALKTALLMTGTTVFIANGASAGQQSPHFMIHIIPREAGDKVDCFGLESSKSDQQAHDDAYRILSHNMPILMFNHFNESPASWHKNKPVKSKKAFSKGEVISIIEKNPPLKKIIEEQPEVLVSELSKNKQLMELFLAVDVNDIILHFNKKWVRKEIVISKIDPNDQFNNVEKMFR